MTLPDLPRDSWNRARASWRLRFLGVPIGRWIWLGLGLGTLILAFVGADLVAIADALALLGWGFALLLGLRLGAIALSALGWRALFDTPRPGLSPLLLVRWVGEAINTLLPVAQVGGDIVRARLAAYAADGAPLARASAAVLIDMSVALLAQLIAVSAASLYLAERGLIGFGVAVLLASAAALPLAALIVSQRYGLVRGLDKIMHRTSADHSSGALQGAALSLYRRPLALGAALAWHLGAWALRAGETWAAINLMGWPLSFAEAMALESLSGAARTVGFFVPAGLGIQEFSLLGVGAWLGLGGAPVLALAAVKRGREILLGLMGLALWPLLESGRRQR